jgi:hypothetical protein
MWKIWNRCRISFSTPVRNKLIHAFINFLCVCHNTKCVNTMYWPWTFWKITHRSFSFTECLISYPMSYPNHCSCMYYNVYCRVEQLLSHHQQPLIILMSVCLVHYSFTVIPVLCLLPSCTELTSSLWYAALSWTPGALLVIIITWFA